MRAIQLLLSFLLISGSLSAQLPTNNLYLFDIKPASDGAMNFENPRFLTAFNENGYNNQPHFFSNDEVYISVDFPNDSIPTDIYALHLKNKTLTQVTKTAEAEYSPTLAPNGYHFTAVRVEADEAGTQHLWQFSVDRRNKGQRIFEVIKGVGYHHWINRDQVAMFVVGEPHTLVIADKSQSSYEQILENVGRCFQKQRNGHMAFVQKVDGINLIKSYNPSTKAITNINATVPGSEDFVILEDGSFLMGSGHKLYRYDPSNDDDWVEVGNFKYYGFKKISRLAYRAGQLIMVVE